MLTEEDIKLYCGDCLDKLKNISDCSVDLVVTDPPYKLNKTTGSMTSASKTDNNAALGRMYIVKALNKEDALDKVMLQYINELNSWHAKENQALQNKEHTEGVLFSTYTKEDLLVYTLDEYMEKFGEVSAVEIFI